MNGHQRSTRKRPRAVPSCPRGFPAPQITASRSHDPSRESFPALLSACELIPSSDGGYAGLSKWCVYRSRNRSSPTRQQSTIVVSIFLALLWGFAIASNTTTTSNVASIHNRGYDRTETGKNAQLTFTNTGHQADNRELGPLIFDPRLRFCSNIASRLCGKCSSYYKKLVKKKKCKMKECKKKFRNCMFGKSRTLVRKFNLHCDNRLKVTWPIKNIFGRLGRYRGRKFDYRKMRLVDWCRPPKVRRPKPRNSDDCGEEIEYYAEMEVLLDLYCPVNEQNQPIQPQDERSLMERGILQFLNSESECFGDDECEQIRYDTSTIQELIAGEDCCPIYAAQNIACPTASRFLISEEFYGSMESFEAIMNRQLQRRRKTKVKKRLSGRCRSRKKKCRRKEKRRRLEVSFDSVSGSMSIPVGDGGGKVSTYSLRNGGTIDNGSKQREEKNPLPRPTHVARHLQTDLLEVNIGDLTPAQCEALTLEESIRQQDPVAFRTITSTEEEEYVEYPSCQDPSSFECNSPLGGYVCCGKGQCKCDIGSNTRCEEGTLFGTTQTQCYLNSNGLQGNIASRQDNLCCDLYVGPPISYRYDCSASVCGPLPTAQCGRQPWINTIDSGSINARAGTFVIEVDFNIIDVCSATLANRNSIEMTVRGVVDTYVKNLIQYSGCGRSNLSENGVTVSSVNVVANTDKCPGNLRRLGVPEGTASRKLQSGTICVDSTTEQTAPPSVTFSAQITGQFRTYQPLAFPIEEGIVYDGFDPPASAPSPGDQNACSCDSLICKEVRDALINTSGANVKNAGITTTGIEIQISTPDPTPSPTKAPSKSPTKDPTRNPTSSPTKAPTKQPTPRPTSPPTRRPTNSPTNTLSRLPSDIPSALPSTSPSRNPSLFPSLGPSESSALPSSHPSSTPTLDPSLFPSSGPSKSSALPIPDPSSTPTLDPSAASQQPSLIPSSKPSQHPSSGPSVRPSVSNAPSFEPSATPSISLSPSVSEAPTQDFGIGRICSNASECEAPPPFSGNDGSTIDAWLDITNMNITCAVKAKDVGTNTTRCCIPTGAPCSSKIKTTDNDPFKGCCNQGCSGGILGTCG